MRLLGGELFQRAIRSEGFVEFARHLGGECAVPFEYLGRGRPQPRRSRPGRRLIVQPDATITAPDSKVLLEAKGMRTSSFVHCRRSESPRADAERLLQGVHPGAFARSESYVSRNTISASSISVAIRLEPACSQVPTGCLRQRRIRRMPRGTRTRAMLDSRTKRPW
jgi:hypothetical protein